MQLTLFTDYSFRVLLYLGIKKERSTLKEISKNFRISQNHLTKVVSFLGQKGLITSFKGKNGGLQLAEATLDLKIGDIIKITENSLAILECFDPHTNTCPLVGVCKLEKALYKARLAFFAELNKMRIRDLISQNGVDPRIKILNIAI